MGSKKDVKDYFRLLESPPPIKILSTWAWKYFPSWKGVFEEWEWDHVHKLKSWLVSKVQWKSRNYAQGADLGQIDDGADSFGESRFKIGAIIELRLCNSWIMGRYLTLNDVLQQ